MNESKQPREPEPTSRREWRKAIVVIAVLLAVLLGIATLYMVCLWWLANHILIDS